MKTIRLILIEDNRLLREGLSAMIKEEPDIKVVAEFGDSNKVLEKVSELKPNIILLDLGIPDQNSMELVKYLKDECLI